MVEAASLNQQSGNSSCFVLQFDFVVPFCYHYKKSLQIEDLAMQTIDVNQAMTLLEGSRYDG
jgi:hypothetical protein